MVYVLMNGPRLRWHVVQWIFSLIQMEQTLEAAAAADVGPFSYHSI